VSVTRTSRHRWDTKSKLLSLVEVCALPRAVLGSNSVIPYQVTQSLRHSTCAEIKQVEKKTKAEVAGQAATERADMSNNPASSSAPLAAATAQSTVPEVTIHFRLILYDYYNSQ